MKLQTTKELLKELATSSLEELRSKCSFQHWHHFITKQLVSDARKAHDAKHWLTGMRENYVAIRNSKGYTLEERQLAEQVIKDLDYLLED